MSNADEKYIEADGLRIFYTVAGQGKPVLLVHGWPTSSYIWRKIIPGLAEIRRVYAIDLPGFGRSDKPLQATYSFTCFSRFIAALADELQLREVDLVLHDIGGPAGILWASRQPERTSRIALLNAPVYPWRTFLDALSQVMLRTPIVRSLMVGPVGFPYLFKANVVNRAALTPEVLRSYRLPYRQKRSSELLLRTILGPLSSSPNELHTISEKLRALNKPTALIYGEGDRLCGAHMRRLAEEFSAATAVPLAGCGHYLQEDCPEQLTRHLRSFLMQDS